MNRNKKDSVGAFQQKAVAVAVAVVCANMAYADEWKPNAEVFVKPGSERGLAGVDALIPLRQDADSLFFADVKAHLDTQSANEFNLGLGYRNMLSNSDWALGVYGAWDRRHSRNGNDFDQGTLGIEGRSSVMDLRANYYHPFTDKKLINWSNDIQFSGFGVYRKGYYEEAMRGYDAEVGVLVPISDTVETRVYLAGYHYDGQDIAPDTNGARLRLEVRPQQNLIVGLSHQHDSLFGSVTFAELRYAFGQPSTSGIRKIRQRMTDPWVRDIDVVISPVLLSHRPEDGQTLLDPLTGKPIQAVHIDNKRGNDGYSGSDIGSYEHPYASADGCYGGKCELTVGETNVGRYDTIYLWQGNSLTTPYTTAMRGAVFQLLDGQKLWGEGYNPLTGALNPTKRPVIDGGEGGSSYGADGIRLASNATIGNMVVGLDIQNTPHGIIGANTGGMVVIHDVGMTNVNRGIELTNDVSGAAMETVSVAESSGFTQTVDIHDVNISSNDDAIHLHNRANYGSSITQTVTIRDSVLTSAYGNGISMQNEAGGGNYYGVSTNPGSITQTATISGNTITAYGDGVGVENTAWGGDGGEGMYVSGGSVNQTLTIADNHVVATNGDGIYVANRAYGGGGYGYGGAVTNTLSVTGNTISSTDGDGVYLYNYANGGPDGGGAIAQTATISGNTISSAYGDGIYVDNYVYDNGSIDQGGLEPASYGGAVGLTIENNTITAGYHGVHLYNDVYGRGSITQNAKLSNNQITSTGYDGAEGGVILENYSNSHPSDSSSISQTVQISGGAISTVYGAGVEINNGATYGGSVWQDVTIDQVAISSANGNGVSVNNGAGLGGIRIMQPTTAYGGTITQSLAITDSSINAYGTGVSVYSVSGYGGNVDHTLSISGSTINAAYGAGVSVGNYAVYGGIVSTVDISNNSGITATHGGGVEIGSMAKYSSGHVTQTATIANNTISAYGLGVGVGSYVENGASFEGSASVTGNHVTVNGGDIGKGWLGGSLAGDGIVVANYASWGANATQTATVSGNTVNVTGASTSADIANNGILLLNVAEHNGASIAQSATVSDNTVSVYGGSVSGASSDYVIANNGIAIVNLGDQDGNVTSQQPLMMTSGAGPVVEVPGVIVSGNSVTVTGGSVNATVGQDGIGMIGNGIMLGAAGDRGGSAYQNAALTNNTVSVSGVNVLVNNPYGGAITYAGNGIAVGADAYRGGDATQKVTIDGAAVVTNATSPSEASSVSVSNVNVTSYGGFVTFAGNGVAAGSVADAPDWSNSVASQTVSVSNTVVTVSGSHVTAGDYVNIAGNGVALANNNGYYNQNGSATQTATLSHNTIGVSGGSVTTDSSQVSNYVLVAGNGVSQTNVAYRGQATQTVTLNNNAITVSQGSVNGSGDYVNVLGNGVVATNGAIDTSAVASQATILNGNTITVTGNAGINGYGGPVLSGNAVSAGNQSTGSGAVATQTVVVTGDSASSEYGGGVILANHSDGFGREAVQNGVITGATIDTPNGNAVEAWHQNNGSITSLQTVTVAGSDVGGSGKIGKCTDNTLRQTVTAAGNTPSGNETGDVQTIGSCSMP